MSWEGQEENYNIYRWYKSPWGRYTQADPLTAAVHMLLANSVDHNAYTYAASSPLNNVDPTGLVRWSKNAPVYRTVDRDTLFRTCGRGSNNAAGCTLYRGSIFYRCQCPCVDGVYRLELTMSLSIQVYARHDDPRATLSQILFEEDKHVAAANRVFDRFVRIGSQYERVYRSGEECWDACDEFGSRFASEWNRAHEAVDESHPRLGGWW